MQHNLSVCNGNNDDIMPMGSARAVNPNDVMLGTHESHVHACQMFLNNIGALHFT